MTASPSSVQGVSDEAAPLSRRLQQKCCDWGAYWRASDAHGVVLTSAQAIELLQDALGVEVEIKDAAAAVGGKADEVSECEWREDDPWGPMPGVYETSCGAAWSFIDGDATENGVKFCHNCGKPVKVIPYPQPKDEDASWSSEGLPRGELTEEEWREAESEASGELPWECPPGCHDLDPDNGMCRKCHAAATALAGVEGAAQAMKGGE